MLSTVSSGGDALTGGGSISSNERPFDWSRQAETQLNRLHAQPPHPEAQSNRIFSLQQDPQQWHLVAIPSDSIWRVTSLFPSLAFRRPPVPQNRPRVPMPPSDPNSETTYSIWLPTKLVRSPMIFLKVVREYAGENVSIEVRLTRPPAAPQPLRGELLTVATRCATTCIVSAQRTSMWYCPAQLVDIEK